jgi:hypothetical protein
MRRRALLAALAAATLAAGCATLTANSGVSRSLGSAKHPYRKIVVIAMSASADERKVFDEAVVARLRASGVEGIVGERYIDNAAVANGVAPMDAIKADGADGVIYAWLRPAHSDARVDPSPGSWGWVGPRAAWYPSGGTVNAMMVRFDVRLYDVATQALAWSGDVTKLYPKTIAVDAPDVADATVRELVKRGFIAH